MSISTVILCHSVAYLLDVRLVRRRFISYAVSRLPALLGILLFLLSTIEKV